MTKQNEMTEYQFNRSIEELAYKLEKARERNDIDEANQIIVDMALVCANYSGDKLSNY